MKRKLMALLLGLTMVLCLAGCHSPSGDRQRLGRSEPRASVGASAASDSQSEKNGETGSSPDEPQDTAEAPAETAPVPRIDPDSEVAQRLSEQFHKHTEEAQNWLYDYLFGAEVEAADEGQAEETTEAAKLSKGELEAAWEKASDEEKVEAIKEYLETSDYLVTEGKKDDKKVLHHHADIGSNTREQILEQLNNPKKGLKNENWIALYNEMSDTSKTEVQKRLPSVAAGASSANTESKQPNLAGEGYEWLAGVMQGDEAIVRRLWESWRPETKEAVIPSFIQNDEAAFLHLWATLPWESWSPQTKKELITSIMQDDETTLRDIWDSLNEDVKEKVTAIIGTASNPSVIVPGKLLDPHPMIHIFILLTGVLLILLIVETVFLVRSLRESEPLRSKLNQAQGPETKQGQGPETKQAQGTETKQAQAQRRKEKEKTRNKSGQRAVPDDTASKKGSKKSRGFLGFFRGIFSGRKKDEGPEHTSTKGVPENSRKDNRQPEQSQTGKMKKDLYERFNQSGVRQTTQKTQQSTSSKPALMPNTTAGGTTASSVAKPRDDRAVPATDYSQNTQSSAEKLHDEIVGYYTVTKQCAEDFRNSPNRELYASRERLFLEKRSVEQTEPPQPYIVYGDLSFTLNLAFYDRARGNRTHNERAWSDLMSPETQIERCFDIHSANSNKIIKKPADAAEKKMTITRRGRLNADGSVAQKGEITLEKRGS